MHLNIILIGVRIECAPTIEIDQLPRDAHPGLFSSHSRMTPGLVSVADRGTILKTGFTKSQMAKVRHFVSKGNQ